MCQFRACCSVPKVLIPKHHYAAGGSDAGVDSATGAGSLAAGAAAAGASAAGVGVGAAADLYDEGRNLNIFVPHTGHVPFAAGRPFFVITICTL